MNYNKFLQIRLCAILYLFSFNSISCMTDNQWKNAPRYNSDPTVICITNAVPVIDTPTVHASSIAVMDPLTHQDSNVVVAQIMHERQIIPLAIVSNTGLQENRRNHLPIHNQLYNRQYPLQQSQERYRCFTTICCAACCIVTLSCMDSCPKCCVIGEKHYVTDGLCCPPTATATLCGCIKCSVLYADNTKDFICYNAACSCCLLSALPFAPFCCCYQALCKK